MQKIKKIFLPLLIFIFILGTYLLAFWSTNSTKGSFYNDEPGIILDALNPNHTVYDIFKNSAYLAQPPLEQIVREKLYKPIGELHNISFKYPEIYHRFLSLIWWIIPIGYFCASFKNYSSSRKSAIILAFFLMISTDFLRCYLTEARHYSAIAASFATMVIVLLVDRASYYQIRFHFFIASLLPPLLHLISFPYYLILVIFFFYWLYREYDKKSKIYFFDLVTFYLIYLVFVVVIYFGISKISAGWQNPKLSNINLPYVNSIVKWTLDWIFYGTPFHPLFKILSTFIKGNFLILLSILAIPSTIFLVKKNIVNKIPYRDITTTFPFVVSFVWPLTIIAVVYRSGMFSCQRYSIAILVFVLFGLGDLISKIIFRLKKSGSQKILLIAIIIILLLSNSPKPSTLKNPLVDSPENKFVKENASIIENKDNYLITDNGTYSLGIPLLARINKIFFNISLSECRSEIFYKDGVNIINGWLDKHSAANVYLLTSGLPLSGNNQIVWRNGALTFYKIKKINDSDLCDNRGYQQISKCHLRCTIGHDPTRDSTVIPGVMPHVDITKR
jgi:hypothetical protein